MIGDTYSGIDAADDAIAVDAIRASSAKLVGKCEDIK